VPNLMLDSVLFTRQTNMYELRSWGNRETGEAHYLVDGVEVTKSEYDRCMAEYQLAKSKEVVQA